jgi:hypothetical protein
MTEQINGQEQVQNSQAEQEQIIVDAGTAFALKLQEFDKKIAESEFDTYDLRKQRASYVYDQNVQQIVAVHKEKVLKSQVEEEAKKKLVE